MNGDDFIGLQFADGSVVRKVAIDLGDGRFVCPTIKGKEIPGRDIFSEQFLAELVRLRQRVNVDPIKGARIR